MKTVKEIIEFIKERKAIAKQLMDEAEVRYTESCSTIARSSADSFFAQYNAFEECLAWIEERTEVPLFKTTISKKAAAELFNLMENLGERI